jgi:hypothetical protein
MTMRIWARVLALCLGLSLVPLAEDETAEAKRKAISGKLSKSGYTVLALSESGAVTSVVAKHGKFKLRPLGKRVTLHLRAPEGTYAGPIVVGREGKRAILGVRAGANLGVAQVKRRKGYAKVKHTPAGKFVDSRLSATAKKGVPIGAGNFGRVLVKKLKGSGSDRDRDGIPTSLDIDDDGDLILDSLDRSTAARAAKAAPPVAPDAFTQLKLALQETANANVPGSTDAQIAAAVSSGGKLILSGFNANTEFDCGGSRNPSPPPPWIGGLPYCTLGGTGLATSAGLPEFPECCDPDGDGFGVVPPGVGEDLPTTLRTGTDQIKTGDQLIGHVASNGNVNLCPNPANPGCTSVTDVLEYVFATVPALVSYHDTAGNAASITYPHTGELPVAPGVDSQIRVTLTIWRPERRPIPEEAGYGVPGAWIDIGGLGYSVSTEGFGPCQQSAFSEDDPTTPTAEDDPNLVLPSGPRVGLLGGLGFTDSRNPPDQPANPSNQLSFTVNLTQCTASSGSWPSGESRSIRLFAVPTQGGGSAQLLLPFKRP